MCTFGLVIVIATTIAIVIDIAIDIDSDSDSDSDSESVIDDDDEEVIVSITTTTKAMAMAMAMEEDTSDFMNDTIPNSSILSNDNNSSQNQQQFGIDFLFKSQSIACDDSIRAQNNTKKKHVTVRRLYGGTVDTLDTRHILFFSRRCSNLYVRTYVCRTYWYFRYKDK